MASSVPGLSTVEILLVLAGGLGNCQRSLGLQGLTDIGLGCGAATLSGCKGGIRRYCAAEPVLVLSLDTSERCVLSLWIENVEEPLDSLREEPVELLIGNRGVIDTRLERELSMITLDL